MQHTSAQGGRAGRMLAATVVCLISMVGAMWLHGDIGILQQGMVAGQARKAAALPNDWPLAEAGSGDLTVLLFTAPDGQGFTAQVYERRTGMEGFYFKFGWFPAYRWEPDAATALPLDTVWYAPLAARDGRPYFSANAAHAAEARTPDGALYRELDPDAPFALVGPEQLAFYDADGDPVPCRAAPDGMG